MFNQHAFLRRTSLTFSLSNHGQVVRFVEYVTSGELLALMDHVSAISRTNHVRATSRVSRSNASRRRPRRRPTSPILSVPTMLITQRGRCSGVTLVVQVMSDHSWFFPFVRAGRVTYVRKDSLLVNRMAKRSTVHLYSTINIRRCFHHGERHFLVVLLSANVVFLIRLVLLPVLLYHHMYLLHRVKVMRTTSVINHRGVRGSHRRQGGTSHSDHVGGDGLVPNLRTSVV